MTRFSLMVTGRFHTGTTTKVQNNRLTTNPVAVFSSASTNDATWLWPFTT